MTKPQLRKELRAALRTLPKQDHATASARICNLIANSSAARSASTIALFDPLPSEPDISQLPALFANSPSPPRFCYPRCEEDRLAFYAVTGESDFRPVPGRDFREPNPQTCALVHHSEIDLILVPGLAFSASSGARLGRGGGFYDRLLADPELHAAKLGVCFALQLRDDIPQEPHDQPVDSVITENSAHS